MQYRTNLIFLSFLVFVCSIWTMCAYVADIDYFHAEDRYELEKIHFERSNPGQEFLPFDIWEASRDSSSERFLDWVADGGVDALDWSNWSRENHHHNIND